MLSVPAKAADTGLLTFQRFVNGDIPVKEAVVYREISDTNGKVLNKEWFRFGYQSDSWFVQRLNPDTAGSSKLVPLDSSIYGASFTHYWIVSDKNLHVVTKDVAEGSLPAVSGKFDRSLMFCTISLGIPRLVDVLSITDAPVNWDGLKFKSVVVSKRDRRGSALATAPIDGQLTVGSANVPASAALPGIGQLPGGVVTYEYSSSNPPGIPRRFTIQYRDDKLRYEFLSLTLGTNDLTATGGYVPSLFADMKLKRMVDQYTNEFAYEQRDGKSYPAFQASPPKPGRPAPPLRGTIWFNSASPLSLDSLRGKVVLLDFWSIHCPSCIEAFPHLESFYNKFKEKGLVVIGVSWGWGSEKRLGPILKDHGVTFPILVDKDLAIADSEEGETEWSYVLDANPSYVLIDKTGDFVWKSTLGSLPTESQIQDLLRK